MEQWKEMDLLSALRADDSNLQMIVNTMPGGVINCLFDEALTLRYVSDGFLNMIGYSRQQLQEEKQNSLNALIPEEEQEILMAEVVRQLSLGNKKEIQYRLRCRDGSFIWVLDKGQLVEEADGCRAFYCVLVDITERIGMERELENSLERHRIIMEQTNDVMFEWSCATKELILSPAWQLRFGEVPQNTALLSSVTIFEQDWVCPEDFPLLRQFIHSIREERETTSVKLRLRDKTDQFVWCQIRITIQRDVQGNPSRYLGVIQDIDRDMRRTEQLILKAQRDALTGLYNRETARSLIEEQLEKQKGQTHALFMIDLDNFKELNDCKGHLYGDAVLMDFGKHLKEIFHKDTIMARYGGDEFLIFIENVGTGDAALAQAKRILNAAQQVSCTAESAFQLSSSVGVALYPQHGSAYDQLFRSADIALYQAKQAGKDNCMIYHTAEFPVPVIARETSMDLASQKQTQSEFDFLYDAPDTAAALKTLLAAVGRQYNVSRVYIFEFSGDGSFMTNTFEWCNDGIIPEINRLQQMPLKEYDNYLANFNENGVFYCHDLSHLPASQQAVLDAQQIKSVLQCTMTDCGKIWGFVGFDECTDSRYWEPIQVEALTRCARIISVFLKKLRLQEKLDGLINTDV